VSIQDKITAMRDMVGGDVRQYIRPPIEKLEQFKKNLFENEDAMNYLKVNRGLAEDTIKYFSLGYDDTKEAIAIPVFKNNELINIRYRYLNPKEKQPKYTQEKDCEVWMYHEQGIDTGLKKGRVLVVEGEFDCMTAWQAGFKSVVSPASGKDSYGIWLELLEPIPEVYIAYDNDKAGKDASYKFADRIGIEKCKEITYPEDIKDANEYFQSHTREDFLELYKEARPFYSRRYNGLIDIINLLREDQVEKLELDILPSVKLTPDHLVTMAGSTNAGKTTYALNIAKKLVERGIPTLVLPYERGVQVVGSRFLQLFLEKSEEQMKAMDIEDWRKTAKKVIETPVYFSVPKVEELEEVITKARKILGIKAVIVDHLDYMVRGGIGTEESRIREAMHKIKSVAIAQQIMMFVVTHTRRVHQAGAEGHKKPTMHDIRGSTAVEQDSETVVILDKVDDSTLEVDVQKNKGKMESRVYSIDYMTGLMGGGVERYQSIDEVI
jgi:twinkle protein